MMFKSLSLFLLLSFLTFLNVANAQRNGRNGNNGANTGTNANTDTGNDNANTGNTNANAGGAVLNPQVIQKASATNGDPSAGQSASLTDPDNFVNFCEGKTLTNGQQVIGGSCNGIVMGDIPSKENMISAMILFPQTGKTVEPNTPFDVSVQVQNLIAGVFTNPNNTYYAAPQQLQGGLVVGHCHVVIQQMQSLNDPTPPPAATFTFFKGIDDDGNGKGLLKATVTAGLPTGFYRICTMMGASNHQPPMMPVAQRGAQEDCTKFEVTDGNTANTGNNANTGNSANTGATTTNNRNGGGRNNGGQAATTFNTATTAASAVTTSFTNNGNGNGANGNRNNNNNNNGNDSASTNANGNENANTNLVGGAKAAQTNRGDIGNGQNGAMQSDGGDSNAAAATSAAVMPNDDHHHRGRYHAQQRHGQHRRFAAAHDVDAARFQARALIV